MWCHVRDFKQERLSPSERLNLLPVGVRESKTIHTHTECYLSQLYNIGLILKARQDLTQPY